jgi:co-chaperonin GroES (HSP10)
MIIPILHRILVKQDKLEEKDEAFKRAKGAGLVIPTMDEHGREQAAIDTGTVVAIGDTAFRDFGTTSPIQVGDSVVFARHAGKIIIDPQDNIQYVALNDEDVVAKIQEA